MKMEKYSVLMSVYKKEKPEFLRLALVSMAEQTVPPDEIILIEDGPLNDELNKVIADFSAEHQGIFRTVVNEKNLGLGPSLNKGVKECRNELVARMDTDDIAFPDRCEKQLAFFESHPDISVLGGQIEEFESDPAEVVCMRVVPESDEEIKKFMRSRNPMNHMTVMFKKSDVISVGSYRDMLWNEDYDLWIRLAHNNFKLANLPEPIVHARIGDGMYDRRGGLKYFKKEMEIQKLLREYDMISFTKFAVNYAERFIIAGLLPGKVRAWVYKKFARK